MDLYKLQIHLDFCPTYYEIFSITNEELLSVIQYTYVHTYTNVFKLIKTKSLTKCKYTKFY